MALKEPGETAASRAFNESFLLSPPPRILSVRPVATPVHLTQYRTFGLPVHPQSPRW